jgi:hypothetical protein
VTSELVAANLVQPGWLLRVVSDDVLPAEEWLEVYLVLETKLGAQQRVWVYPQDRAVPLIYEWDELVEVRKV